MGKERILQPIMNAILVFECAARLGNFSQAARVLGTSQPSVSRHISNLEAYLGCKLFQRKNNKISTTEEGRKLFQAASTSLGVLNSVIAECRLTSSSNVITIGCTHGFAHLWIMPRFSSLQALFPDWEIRIVTSDFSQVFDPDEIDFSIRFSAGEAQDPVGICLFEEEVVLVASPTYCATHHSFDTRQLQELSLIHLDDGEEDWVSWREWFASHGTEYHPPKGTYFYGNYAFSLQAAAEGKGIALAWRMLIGPYLENGWLEILDWQVVKTMGSYRLVYRDAWGRHAVGSRMVSWFRNEVNKNTL